MEMKEPQIVSKIDKLTWLGVKLVLQMKTKLDFEPFSARLSFVALPPLRQMKRVVVLLLQQT